MEQIGIVLSVRGLGQREPRLKPWLGYKTDTPGLVVCKRPKSVSGGIAKDENGNWQIVKNAWQVIHQESGYVLPYCHSLRTRAVALQVAEAVGSYACWTLPVEEIYDRVRYRAQEYKDIIKEIS